MTAVSQRVHAAIVNAPGGKNVTEWCKREDCWKAVRALDVPLPEQFAATLLSDAPVRDGASYVREVPRTPEDQRNIEVVKLHGGEAWLRLSAWAKQANALQGWQRGIAYSVGKRLVEQRDPTPKQARQAVLIMEEAVRLGFRADVQPERPAAEGSSARAAAGRDGAVRE